MRRIPYRFLKDSCLLRIYRREGAFGGLVKVCETQLSAVCIQRESGVSEDKWGRRDICGGRIYYDCRRSLPEEAAISAEGCVSAAVIHGVEYRITDIRYCYAQGSLHHIEMQIGGVL